MIQERKKENCELQSALHFVATCDLFLAFLSLHDFVTSEEATHVVMASAFYTACIKENQNRIEKGLRTHKQC